MRRRDPRRLLRRGEKRAEVRICRPWSGEAPDGSVTSLETAEVTMPRDELDRIWRPEYLERLARTYWRFLTKVSLGILRVLYTPTTREVAVFKRPFVLLRFSAPEYDTRPDRGSATWRIEKGLLVATRGRGRGYLRLTVEKLDADSDPEATVKVTSEVANFYPRLAGPSWFDRIGLFVYRTTQLQAHVLVTHAFLRSLRRLDLKPSVVGALLPPEERPPTAISSR